MIAIKENPKTVIEIEWLHRGQERRYGDTVVEANIKWSATDGVGSDLSENLVKKEIFVLVGEFYETPEWHQPRLETLEKIDKGYWHVKIRQPYLD